MRKFISSMVVVAVAALSLSAYASSYLTVTGIIGNSLSKNHKGAITMLRFNLEMTAAQDMATAKAGKINYKPLVITREIDNISPQLLHAFATGEAMKTATLELAKPGGDGVESTYYTIRLHNVTISGIHQYTETSTTTIGTGLTLEDVSFSYEKIEVETADKPADPKPDAPIIRLPIIKIPK